MIATWTATYLMGGVLFSAIGSAACVYGKRMGLWKPIALGFVLMIYPFFVDSTGRLYGLGVLLTAALFYFRD
jgi:hypothetical protein